MTRVIVELRLPAVESDEQRLAAMTQTREALLRELPAGAVTAVLAALRTAPPSPIPATAS